MAKQKTEFSAENEAKRIMTTLLELIGLEGTASVKEDKTSAEPMIEVNIDAEKETGLLIGTHGSTLNAIQVFLGMALRQRSGEWMRVVVNIGDWKEKQEEQLTSLALQTSGRAKSTGEPQRLYNLTPSQRRVIHVALAEDSEIETVSEGEGAERHLIIRKKA